MNDRELADFLEYTNPKELYVVTYNNLLKLLFCPFRVFVLQNIGDLKKGETEWVEQVKVTSELITVYIIGDKAYYYHHFDIVL